ncbi:ABC transporter G family member 23 [Rhynchospora pubera]|uniref:ABC transporter G family member 23 n=1 Tax=Rhynchospora pubera TaxID=906938 RepID=A0AAV8EYQ4_9POAL|nr:ABC transporter G family member 23 [Rhynchospora pubera]
MAAHCIHFPPAPEMEDTCLDLDHVSLSTNSSSPPQSTSPSSSFYHPSPPPCIDSVIPAYKLVVNDLSYTIRRTKNGPISWLRPNRKPCSSSIHLLKSVSFVAKSSEILAIVGPSGAGKSTLLRTISGRVKHSDFDPKCISFNDQPASKPSRLRKLCGFVTQEDNLLPLLTVKETLMFSAQFRIKGMSSKEKEERVLLLMQELGLEHIADSYIGDEEVRGISGGERKRVSIAIDVIHDPPILLLDEPTSGLDSTSALQVLELLSSMAKVRKQIFILTIHQPSYRMLQYLSSFLILSHGTVAHHGSLQSLEDVICQLGLKIPTQLNPLEFVMEITDQLVEYKTECGKFITNCKEMQDSEECSVDEGFVDHDQYCSRSEEIITLSSRFWKMMYRTKQLFAARTMQAIVGGLGLGSVYYHVRANEDGIAERLGLFAFSLSFLLSSTVEALPIFLQERRVLMRETSRRMYRLSSYMVANTIIFIPFLLVVALFFAIPVYWLVGLNPSFHAFMFFVFVVWMIVLMASSLVLFLSAISPDFILGNSLICIFLGVFFLFSGYFIPKDSIPKYWLFMYYVSPYRYPLDALLINEYGSMSDKCFSWIHEANTLICARTGADVLRARHLDESMRWRNIGIMCGFFLIYRVLCWILLVRRASKTTL